MQIHADLSLRAVVQTAGLVWTETPMSGVLRKLIERDGAEVARATSLVQYAAGSRFFSHTHDLGEEFLVLEGDFNDEHGSYGAGTYVKNPPGSAHAPYTVNGCTLFVKLRHMQPHDSIRCVVDTEQAHWLPGALAGVVVAPLSTFDDEKVFLLRVAAGTQFPLQQYRGGAELWVVSGSWQDEDGSYPVGSWIRMPHLSTHTPWSEHGCLILIKTGHLAGQQNESA